MRSESEYYLDFLTKEENNYIHQDLAGYEPDQIILLEGYEAILVEGEQDVYRILMKRMEGERKR